MNALEELGQPYLFKLRQSVGAKKLIKQQWQDHDWSPVGQGWQACEDELRPMGYEAEPIGQLYRDRADCRIC